MMFWYAQLRSLPSFSTKNLIPQMCTSLSKNKLLIAGCTCLAIGFISALSGIMTSVWAVKEYSDNQGLFKSVTFGLWHFRRCGGFRINGECNKGELQQTDIQYFGAEGLLLRRQAPRYVSDTCIFYSLLYFCLVVDLTCMIHEALISVVRARS